MKAIEREYKAMLAPDRIAWMRNQEGLECQVRILREYPDRYVVGNPDPAKNGPAICRMFKDEWEIEKGADIWYVPVAFACVLILGVIIGCILNVVGR